MAAALQMFLREIDSTIAHSSRERRASMARHLTDFFVVGSDEYSEEEIQLVDDVFVRLVSTIEESARALLSIRLAGMSKAPPKILRMLANDDAVDIAAPILMQSELLDDLALVECAKAKSQEHLLAISRRKVLHEIVTDVLVERGDQQVIFSAARNPGAKFSVPGFSRLVDRTVDDDRLTVCVGRRHDVPPHLFRRLLKHASEAVRSKLEAELSREERVGQVVADIADQVRSEADSRAPVKASAKVLIDSLHTARRLDTARVEAFAAAGQIEEVIFALAMLSEVPPDVVEDAIEHCSFETLIIMCKAIALSWTATKSILLLCPGKDYRSIETGFSAFHRLQRTTAQQILKFHRTRGRFGASGQNKSAGGIRRQDLQ
jgi:uncharacterized protein (DUF2336 family)